MEGGLIPREPVVKDMTPKERKRWFKERMDRLSDNKRTAKVRHEVMIATDSLMVHLRDRMYLTGNLKCATVVEDVRQAKMKREGDN